MLGSGTRLIHALKALKNWRPEEELYVQYLNRNIRRLERLEYHHHYYLGKEDEVKPVALMYFPRVLLLPLVRTYAGKLPSRLRIYKVAVKKLGVLAPKYIRTFALRKIKKVIGDNDVYRFIVGKFGGAK